jgi:nitrite reductase/ring-hydroxylating ferredoxin subunit
MGQGDWNMTMLSEEVLAGRVGPVLSDGVALGDLIDLDRREVAFRVLSDPEIHRLELSRIWARSWVGVGHVAEIPNPGDFMLRHIGEDPVIVTRDREGALQILLNVCAHRGMEICWADEGNQSQFKCPYHGWVFDNAGNLLGAPFEHEMYGDWDKSQYGLRTAKVAQYHGRIFGNFDPNAMPLDEWLGDAAWYLDRAFPKGDPEWENLMSPRRWVVHANWKTSADNNSGDMYHGSSLHKSISELGPSFVSKEYAESPAVVEGLKVSTAMGHGIVGFNFGAMSGTKKYGDPDYYDLDGYTFACMVFPATFGIGSSWNQVVGEADGMPMVIAQNGALAPRGPGKFEMWTSSAVDKRVPVEMREMFTKPGLLDLAGVDDTEGWPSIQRTTSGGVANSETMKYNVRREPSPHLVGPDPVSSIRR